MNIGYFFKKVDTRGLKGACLSRNKLSLNRFLLRKECFIRKEDNYGTFGGTLMYYRDTYETFSGYGIFFPKNQVYWYKKNCAFQQTKAPFAKGRFQFTDCLYC